MLRHLLATTCAAAQAAFPAETAAALFLFNHPLVRYRLPLGRRVR